MKVFIGLIRNAVKDQMQHSGTIILSLVFFALVCALVPIGLQPSESILTSIGPGIISTSAFLSTLITVNSLFQRDFEDGVVEQMILSHHGASLYATAKILTQSLILLIPIVVFLPLMAILYHLSPAAIIASVLAISLAMPALVALAAVGAALTVKTQSPLLTVVIILPFYAPILVFSSMAIANAEQGLTSSGPYLVLASLLLLNYILTPVACSMALKLNCE